MLLSDVEYLNIGRCIVPLLGSVLTGSSAEALRELARAYDPSADESLISADQMLVALGEINRLYVSGPV